MNPSGVHAPFRLRRSVGVGYRRATYRRRALPGVLLIGTVKGGTSSFFRWVIQHPQMAAAATGKKELRFFDTFYDRGVAWYRSQFPLASRLASGGYEGVEPGARCIDATPNYLFHPLAPQRAASLVPEAKLVVLLRNPVDRALSHYAMNKRVGSDRLSIEDAFRTEAERIAPSLELARAGVSSRTLMPYEYFSYLSRGRYAEQLRRWYACYPRSQVFVARSEDLFADPAAMCERIVSFLELDPWAGPAFPARNVDQTADISPDLRRALEARFAEPNEELAELAGIRW